MAIDELTTVDLERSMKLSYEMLINCYDKAGVPLIYHSAAVASLCGTIEEKIVAYLHDVLEDGKSEQKKEAFKIVCTEFDIKIRNAIYAITRKEGERYKDYLDRVKGNDLARHVKIADLKHNLMQWRLSNDVYQSSLIKRYQMALDFLSEKEKNNGYIFNSDERTLQNVRIVCNMRRWVPAE